MREAMFAAALAYLFIIGYACHWKTGLLVLGGYLLGCLVIAVG